MPSAELPKLVTQPMRVPIPPHGVAVFESRHGPGFEGELCDDFSKFMLIITGQARWKTERSDRLLGPDTLCHIPAGLAHHQRDLPGEPVTVFCIHFSPKLLTETLQTGLANLEMCALDLRAASINQSRAMRALFRELLFEQDARPEGWRELSQARLVEIAVRTLRMGGRKKPVTLPEMDASAGESAARVAHYASSLRSRFYSQETLDEAARSVDLSRRQFTEIFRKITGETWRRYVQNLRLEHAARLLEQTEKSVIATAFESGFEDLSHFNRCFKSTYRLTPGQWREKHR